MHLSQDGELLIRLLVRGNSGLWRQYVSPEVGYEKETRFRKKPMKWCISLWGRSRRGAGERTQEQKQDCHKAVREPLLELQPTYI